jgi:predicted adenine nucleotide alpha hydrolase (AANH) superfamily ATPase
MPKNVRAHEVTMMNYQKELDRIIEQILASHLCPKLLLHSCCAPCSSYCIEYLSDYFEITVFYYNPNIYPEEEYNKRVREQKEFLSSMPTKNPVKFLQGEYHPTDFYQKVNGYENNHEGEERCFLCYELRLNETAKLAKKEKFDYFTTTLSISPYKNAEKLNTIGNALAQKYGVAYLPSDFKKRNGYKRSIELSSQYGLYRQNYCGCVYSWNAKNQLI